MRLSCYWCLGPETKRPHDPNCPALRGVPESHRPLESTQPVVIALPPAYDADDEPTAPGALPRHLTEPPYTPAHLRGLVGM